MRRIFILTALFASAGFAMAAEPVATDSTKQPPQQTGVVEKAREPQAAAQPETSSSVAPNSPAHCPDGMIGVTAKIGTFVKRQHSFCVDQYEFPNRPGKFPVTNVSWLQAKQLCSERGVRLCSDDEWTAACRGPEKWKYPYGKKYDKEKCVTHGKYLMKVGSREECRSAYGAYDMVGNVAEWTGSGGVISLGGAWDDGKFARCTEWKAGEIDRAYKSVGFRCCADAAK